MKDVSPEAAGAEWKYLANEQSDRARSVITTVYQQSLDRLAALEAKAIGMLTAVAILAAGASVACTGTHLPSVLGITAFVFLASAGLACCWILYPRSRRVLTLEDVGSATGGVAEMAAAARMMEPHGARVTNMITAATYDLVRSLFVTLAAVVAFVVLKPG